LKEDRRGEAFTHRRPAQVNPAGLNGPPPAKCPSCGGELRLQRVDDLRVLEYRGSCQGCGWTGALRRLRCGGCHLVTLFFWTGAKWRCTRCGRVKGGISPPRRVKAHR